MLDTSCQTEKISKHNVYTFDSPFHSEIIRFFRITLKLKFQPNWRLGTCKFVFSVLSKTESPVVINIETYDQRCSSDRVRVRKINGHAMLPDSTVVHLNQPIPISSKNGVISPILSYNNSVYHTGQDFMFFSATWIGSWLLRNISAYPVNWPSHLDLNAEKIKRHMGVLWIFYDVSQTHGSPMNFLWCLADTRRLHFNWDRCVLDDKTWSKPCINQVYNRIFWKKVRIFQWFCGGDGNSILPSVAKQ